MSSSDQQQQPIDPDLIEQTKRQIHSIVNEIGQLAKSEVSEAEFYESLLNKAVAALAAVGGAVWTFNEQGHLQLAYQIRLQDTGLADNPQGQIRHGQLLRKAVERARESGQGLLAAPQSGGGDEDEAGNPTDHLLVIGPLRSDQEVKGLVEVFQRPNSQPNVQRGYLNFLLKVCEIAGDYLKTRSLRSFADRQMLWTQLEQFAKAAHSSLDPSEAAFTIANEGRRLIQCDRVCVAIKRGSKCQVEAVSGQDVFDNRSNVIVLLNRLASAVAKTGEPVWFTGDAESLAPQVEDAIQEYVDESHSKMVAVLPLRKPAQGPDERGQTESGEVVGALVVEQVEKGIIEPALTSRVEVVSDHACSALTNALDHHNVFLMPLWKQIGRAKWLIQAQQLPKTVAAAIAAVVILVALFIVPADFNLHGDGSLQSKVRRGVFAATSGKILDVMVHEGDFVEQGKLLVEMENNQLQAQIESLQGEINSYQKQIDGYDNALQAQGITPAEKVKLFGDREAAIEDRKGAIAEQTLYRAEMDSLNIESPISGQVVTWQVLDELKRRPVTAGDMLMEVADPDGDLEIEVLMPEDAMGHILKAEKRRLAEIEEGGSPDRIEELKKGLAVEYILATHPQTTLHGYVEKIYTSAEVRGEEGATVLIRVRINRDDLPQIQEGGRPQLGSKVTARVYCGRRPIGYVWFHDLFAFVHRTWFKVF